MPANAKIRQLHDRLTPQVEALLSGEDCARFLAVASRFHIYSTGAGRYSNPPNTCSRGSSQCAFWPTDDDQTASAADEGNLGLASAGPFGA